MPQFPDWIPEEVVVYYRQLGAEEHADNTHFEQSDIRALYRCMKSSTMEKAWQAINKRKEKNDPAKFAHLIALTNLSARRMHTYPTLTQIATYRKLAKKSRTLSEELQTLFDQLTIKTRDAWFGDSPNKYLEDLAERLERSAGYSEATRKRLTGLTGKPQSKNSKRTYVIRCLSEGIQRWYGQPLHKVVTLTSSEILKEYVDEETARKLVS